MLNIFIKYFYRVFRYSWLIFQKLKNEIKKFVPKIGLFNAKSQVFEI